MDNDHPYSYILIQHEAYFNFFAINISNQFADSTCLYTPNAKPLGAGGSWTCVLGVKGQKECEGAKDGHGMPEMGVKAFG